MQWSAAVFDAVTLVQSYIVYCERLNAAAVNNPDQINRDGETKI